MDLTLSARKKGQENACPALVLIGHSIPRKDKLALVEAAHHPRLEYGAIEVRQVEKLPG